jgi:phosphate uptake regulator
MYMVANALALGGFEMESRKIQKVGAATLTISLPKNWVTQRKLKRGDPVFIVEDGEALKILPSQEAAARKRSATEFIVDADLCDEPGMLERVIVGNYVLGREKITVQSSRRLQSQHLDEVRGAMRRLMGIGILDETPSLIVLHCSVDPTNYPLEALIKRLYNLGATMLSESLEALKTSDRSLAEDAMKREDDADMMYWLILRLLLSAQLDDALVERLGIRSRLEIAGYRAIARDLEIAADHAHEIAMYVQGVLREEIEIPNSIVAAFTVLADLIGQTFALALGALLSRDLKQANAALSLSNDLKKREQEVVKSLLRESRGQRKREPSFLLPVTGILRGMAQIGGYGRSIALIAYNRYLEKPSNLCHPAAART